MNFTACAAIVSQSVTRAVSSLPSVNELSQSAQIVSNNVSNSIQASSKVINKFNTEYCPSCQKGNFEIL